ncbi:putative serine protease K12H4.7 [Cydia pomonella]|uniref:putative serine protease K12H4.7 n=1 Tax=Cydia pomonella TaxID=82600 RepID=UPI002ADD8C03|nr:putative serine protease K12H4.7 [Cydia pomonella]
MHYLCMITLLISSATAFTNNLNHLLLNLDLPQTNMTSADEKWIEQPLDHFDPKEKRTLKMRYFENLQFWQPNAPIIVFIGGEGKVDPMWIGDYDVFLTVKMAKETHGALFATEHRYYGKSLPDIPKDNTIEYYKFLSSHQALEDLASLIKMLKSNSKYKSSKVVVVGGSYAGNLAVWMKKLYPELVDAALSSSAPVLAKKDFKEYFDTVRYTFGKYGNYGCLDKIKKNFKVDEDLLKTPEGREELKKKYNICPEVDMAVLENQQLFFSWFEYLDLKVNSQYGLPYIVKGWCRQKRHKQREVKPIWRNGCNDVDFKHYDWTQGPYAAWIYQTCTEFGYEQTTSSEKQPFVHWNPLEFLLKSCKGFVKGDIEKTIDEGVARTNKRYGGLTPNVTKVVFTHGDMDPWHTLGVLQDLGPDAPVIMTNGTSHCGVLVMLPGEPVEMKKNRKHVIELIMKWISQ